MAHLHSPSNGPKTYKLPTPFSFQDVARTRFHRSRSYFQSRSDHAVGDLHSKTMSLPSTNFLHLMVSEMYIAQTIF